MKYIFIVLASIILIACEKDVADSPPNFDMEGYWLVASDTTFTRTAANSTADLYHLFRKPNAYYRFSFPKTFDFSVLTAKPRSDSMISYYQILGDQLQLPNPAPSASFIVPGYDLISKTSDEMIFTRPIINSAVIDPNTGKQARSGLDTIIYTRVSDPTKKAYFDNYLKQWHP